MKKEKNREKGLPPWETIKSIEKELQGLRALLQESCMCGEGEQACHAGTVAAL